MNYFQTQLRTVSIGGITYENVQVVSNIRYDVKTKPSGFIEVPSGYENLDILECAYFPNEEVLFKKVDKEPQELTQLDIIEANTTYLVMMSE